MIYELIDGKLEALMKSINSVACKAFIKQFYQENTGFFLLTLSFGFLRTPHHVDLAGLFSLQSIILSGALCVMDRLYNKSVELLQEEEKTSRLFLGKLPSING